MRESRTAAMEYLRRAGEVYKAGDIWYITSYGGVRLAQKHPESFSSAHAAFERRCVDTSTRSPPPVNAMSWPTSR
jgi:hypothetical protein